MAVWAAEREGEGRPDRQRTKRWEDAGFTRTITDGNKNIKGVIYHANGKRSEFERAKEVYPRRGPC